MNVKICGITKLDQALAIAEMGADYLGYICVPASPRFVNPEQVKVITNNLQQYKLNHVGVFLDASIEKIGEYTEIAKINFIQLHGQESIAFCQQLRAKFPTIGLIKAFRIQSQKSLEQVFPYIDLVDIILVDAYDPLLAGGTGKTIDWSILNDFKPSCNWWLAGGLSPHNVKIAIAQLQPNGIDVSSGVEKSAGDKDLDQVKCLLQRAKPNLKIQNLLATPK